MTTVAETAKSAPVAMLISSALVKKSPAPSRTVLVPEASFSIVSVAPSAVRFSVTSSLVVAMPSKVPPFTRSVTAERIVTSSASVISTAPPAETPSPTVAV